MTAIKKQADLKRTFGLKAAIIIVMSAIIGSGVFKKVAPMAAYLHSPWLVILAWLLAGIIVLFGVLCMAELSTMFPDSGGPFIWLDKVYGKLISFLYGWTCFTVVQTAAISSIAFVFAGAWSTFMGLPRLPAEYESLQLWGIYPFQNFGGKLISCLLIMILTLVNIRGSKKGGNLSLVFTFLITVSILIIISVAFSSPEGNLAHLQAPSSGYPKEGFTALALISAMVLAMRSAFWGYEGWLALGFIGEEVHEPKKTLPKALIIGISSVILLYLLINTAYLYVMPINDMLEEVSKDANRIAAVLVVNKILGSGGAFVISAMILISTFGCTNATILVSSRIYYAMARRGLFFKQVAKTHPKFHTPHNSLIFQCVWACILVFSGSFDLLTDLLIIAAFIFNGLIIFGVIWLRIKMKEVHRPFRVPLYPFIPIVFVAFCIVLIGISFYDSPVKSLVGLILIISGLPFYYLWRSRSALADKHENEDISINTANRHFKGRDQ